MNHVDERVFTSLSLTHFWSLFLFYTPILYHLRFSSVFRGYKMGKLARNELLMAKRETKHEMRNFSFRTYFLSENLVVSGM